MIMNDTVKKYIERSKREVETIPEDMQDAYVALLDNQAKELDRISEQTSTKNIDRIATVFLPALKKLARDSIIAKIVGVQPIPDRVAIIQFLDYVYRTEHAEDTLLSSSEEPISAGSSVYDSPTMDYSRAPAEGSAITKGIDFLVKEIGVRAVQRKLAGKWTFEANDASSKLGMNLEGEITKALSAKIVEEVNFEVLNDLYTQASGMTQTWTKPLPSDSPQVKDRKEKEIFFAIADVAADIYNNTRRYPNYVIMSPRTAAYLRRTGEYGWNYWTDKEHSKIVCFWNIE
jgi:hypothetical protein